MSAPVRPAAEAAYTRDTVVEHDDVASRQEVFDIADVVIVGSGAAGATAARVLAESGASVILIEEGPLVRSAEFRADMYSSMTRTWRHMGSQVAQGRAFVPLIQGVCVGGSTAINGAIIHRMPERIHALWRDEHGLGDALPYARLSSVWDTLEQELGVAPAPEDVLGQNNTLMREAAGKIGIRHNPIARSVRGCEGAARCLQGCPTGRKQSMNLSYVPYALRRGARLYATARVEKVFAEGGRAAGVRARFIDPRTRKPGPVLVVRARHAVIVAASALQTPGLLRASGIGKRSGLVGERLQLHPATAVVGVFDRPVKIWFGATQGYETKHFLDEEMKCETVALPPELGAVRLPGLGAELMGQLADYDKIAQWGVEVRSRAHGKVSRGLFGRTTFRWDADDEDVRIVKKGIVLLSEMMLAAGARTILPGVYGLPDAVTTMDEVKRIHELSDDPARFHLISSHHFGTAVMGLDPDKSVVGPDGQSHELPGLYVADGSVFPTAIGVNPQHAICGVSWLVAERIAEGIPAGARRPRGSTAERRVSAGDGARPLRP